MIIPHQACGLDPGKSVYQYSCRTWTYQTGLPVNSINAITQTKDGYIWLGTGRGLVRFDGEEFKLVGMPANSQLRTSVVKALFPSVKGGLWFGLYRSAYGYYDGNNGWKLESAPGGRKDWDVPSIIEAGGKLWIGGIAASQRSLNDSALTLLFNDELTAPDVTAMLVDSKKRIWLGTAGHGLYCWEQGKLTKLENAFSDERFVLSMAEDREGRIWVGTHMGLYWFDSGFQRHDADFPSVEIRALLLDSKGVLWIGTSDSGLACRKNGGFTYLRKADGLASDSVLSLAEDHEGSLWAGTQEGLTQITDVKLPIYSVNEGIIGQSVQSVSASPKGGLWIATDQGAVRYNREGSKLYSIEAGLKTKYIKRIFEASNGDVFLISGRKEIEVMVDGKVVAQHPTVAMPVAMTEDAQGVVVSVAGELYRVGRDYLTPYVFNEGQKPPLYWILNLTSSRDGAIWVACVNGICRIKDGKYQQWTQGDGLVDYHCRWILEDAEGTIWAGMATGISRLKNNQIRNFRQQDGLLDGNIYEIIADDHGDFWVDADRGIFRVSSKCLNDFADGITKQIKCVPFNGPEAMKPVDKYQQEQAACKTLDGRIWFPTSKGVVMIDPENISINRVPPPVYIRTVCANGRDLNGKKNAVVQPGEGDLEFHYAGLGYIAPSKIQYRYKLNGYDRNWVDAGNRRVAFYANLKPGKYNFHVEACNADGIWNNAGDGFAVELLPYYYQTVWFKFLMGSLIIAGAFATYTWRVNHLNSKQKQLQTARDLLEAKVIERTAELAEINLSLKTEIEERKRVQIQAERIQQQLMDASREAGKAEVASSVLHNVGNVLNSVNVSTNLIVGRVRNLRLDNLTKAAHLLKECEPELNLLSIGDSKMKHLPGYLEKLASHVDNEQKELLAELKHLAQNVEHIKQIVAMQQSYAKMFGVVESVSLTELVESALKMESGAFSRHGVAVERQFDELPLVTLDKHKVMQILVNVLHNAKYACYESSRPEKKVTVRIKRDGKEHFVIEITDNGIGIAPENLKRIFGHGFTTKKDGHGFGLHSAVLAAKEMGGTLTAYSEGLGTGATFTLRLPVQTVRNGDSACTGPAIYAHESNGVTWAS